MFQGERTVSKDAEARAQGVFRDQATLTNQTFIWYLFNAKYGC